MEKSQLKTIVKAHKYLYNIAEEVIRIFLKGYDIRVIDSEFALKDEYDISKGIRGRFYSPEKKSTTIRLDDDVILDFRKKVNEEKSGY